MNQRNASNKPQTLKINVTIPLPEKPQATPANPTYAGCGGGQCSACGKCGQQNHQVKDAIGQVAEILLMLASGQCPPDQVRDAGPRIEALLRRYYARQ